uniref:C3H1-type domain-containing protein n=1 Tax=Chromera velia CCMP2878 TaxID=1169474 RepID=A0A0G4HEX0_9ALVE|eukprot:Cvel_26722.t1-p1 / transcript=Cvel_26722.t1 / gene=Cvel_26722 / organism=Chromera_velia_CCMP2878 / gene_product=Zinc finger protein 36, C3H1 type-like 2, putative / transcript_product=Zinc finger protein 36, C3H1 type-like 2, putative / location=Cvel_scaffold3224:3570-6969(+) / protein_length=874 / sequence_SO=supercontig / SO=protein_coding / is_pseudo=false
MKKVNASRDNFYKTKMCPHLEKGNCRKGEECFYAHSKEELRSPPDLRKTRLCDNFMQTGKCDRGESCGFAHGEKELRFTQTYYKTDLCKYWKAGKCHAGPACRHAHGVEELKPRKYNGDEIEHLKHGGTMTDVVVNREKQVLERGKDPMSDPFLKERLEKDAEFLSHHPNGGTRSSVDRSPGPRSPGQPVPPPPPFHPPLPPSPAHQFPPGVHRQPPPFAPPPPPRAQPPFIPGSRPNSPHVPGPYGPRGASNQPMVAGPGPFGQHPPPTPSVATSAGSAVGEGMRSGTSSEGDRAGHVGRTDAISVRPPPPFPSLPQYQTAGPTAFPPHPMQILPQNQQQLQLPTRGDGGNPRPFPVNTAADTAFRDKQQQGKFSPATTGPDVSRELSQVIGAVWAPLNSENTVSGVSSVASPALNTVSAGVTPFTPPTPSMPMPGSGPKPGSLSPARQGLSRDGFRPQNLIMDPHPPHRQQTVEHEEEAADAEEEPAPLRRTVSEPSLRPKQGLQIPTLVVTNNTPHMSFTPSPVIDDSEPPTVLPLNPAAEEERRTASLIKSPIQSNGDAEGEGDEGPIVVRQALTRTSAGWGGQEIQPGRLPRRANSTIVGQEKVNVMKRVVFDPSAQSPAVGRGKSETLMGRPRRGQQGRLGGLGSAALLGVPTDLSGLPLEEHDEEQPAMTMPPPVFRKMDSVISTHSAVASDSDPTVPFPQTPFGATPVGAIGPSPLNVGGAVGDDRRGSLPFLSGKGQFMGLPGTSLATAATVADGLTTDGGSLPFRLPRQMTTESLGGRSGISFNGAWQAPPGFTPSSSIHGDSGEGPENPLRYVLQRSMSLGGASIQGGGPERQNSQQQLTWHAIVAATPFEAVQSDQADLYTD